MRARRWNLCTRAAKETPGGGYHPYIEPGRCVVLWVNFVAPMRLNHEFEAWPSGTAVTECVGVTVKNGTNHSELPAIQSDAGSLQNCTSRKKGMQWNGKSDTVEHASNGYGAIGLQIFSIMDNAESQTCMFVSPLIRDKDCHLRIPSGTTQLANRPGKEHQLYANSPPQPSMGSPTFWLRDIWKLFRYRGTNPFGRGESLV